MPACVIVGCFFTVKIAFQNADAVVDDGWRKNGLSVEKQIEKEHQAKALGLTAQIAISRTTGKIQLNLRTALNSDKIKEDLKKLSTLTLKLEHPTNESYDQKIQLHQIKTGVFEGELVQFYSGLRYVNLLPPSNDWKLKGKITLFTKNYQSIL